MKREEADGRISENQDFGKPKQIGSFEIDLAARKAEFEAQNGTGIDHEFQKIGKELEPIFGKRIWADFHRSGYTEAKIKAAFEICKKRGKIKYDYFRACLILLRHKPNGDPAYPVISGKSSRSFDLSNAAPMLGFCIL